MDIIIQSLGFKASDNLEAFIHEKLGKLVNQDNVIRANVILYQGSDSNPENNYCEIRLEIPGNDHFVKKNSPIFERSITEAFNALQKIMKKYKGKEIDRRQAEPDADSTV